MSASTGGLHVRRALVVAQTALSVVLLVGAGLFVRSLVEANRIERGFETGPAALVRVEGQGSGYESGTELMPVVTDALTNLRARTEVESAALATRLPLTLGTWVRLYDVPGVEPPPGRNNHRIEITSVSEEYFDVMGIPILEGRPFEAGDDSTTAPVAIVSRILADTFWPGESALGRTLLPVANPESPVTVVGVAGNVKIWSVTEPDRPYIYTPLEQDPSTTLNLVVRGHVPPEALGRIAVESLTAADPDLFIPEVATMEEHLANVLFLPRLGAVLVGVLALMALGLSAIGLYGIVSYGVSRRTREMGIRISLGARAADVVKLVVRRGLLLAAVGALLGLVAAMAAARLLTDFLIGVNPWDPLTLAGVPTLLLLVAAVAALLPARRASHVDPAEALRAE